MNKHLYWKLQSINNTDMIEAGSEEFNIYREKFKKNFETRELMSEEETLIHYNYNAWRNPLFSKIYSLTIAFVHEGVLRVKYLTGQEKDLLQTFLNEVKGDFFKDYQLVHSDAEYMLPYIGTRLDIHGFRTSLHKDLQYKNLRPWNLTGVSVRDYYQGAGAYKHSLKEIAWVYGLKTSYIEPSEEFSLYKKGLFDNLKDSSVNEISVLANVHRLMIGEDKVDNIEVSEEKVEKVEELKQTDWLVELYNENQFTSQIRDGLKQQLFRGKKKPTKKEKEILFKIIRGIYVRTNFEAKDQDNKEVIGLKEKQIKELLEL
jgi:hypothetical protein